jgi:hypothetical protein
MSVSLVKNLPKWEYFHNDGDPVPEYILMSRRYDNGARVSQDWGYYLRDNDPMELWAFFGESRKR